MDDARQYDLYADVDYSADGSVCSRVRSLGCLPPVSVDPCLSSLGACVSALGACVASGPDTPPAEASLSFTLDSGASQCFFRDHTTLIPLLDPVPVALADPSSGPAIVCSSTTLSCPVVPSGVLRGLHIPSFTRNLVGVGYLQDRGIIVTSMGGGRTVVCTDAATGAVLATFTKESRSGLYVLHIERSPVTSSAQVAASPQVPVSSPIAVSGQVVVSGQVAASCSYRSLAHPTVLWHHRLGHLTLPRLRSMASHSLVSSLLRVFPSLPPSLAPPCTHCVAGCLCATLHSSSVPLTNAPFQTLHLDVWGPAPTLGPERERYFLVVVDDYSMYITVFPLAKKSEATSTLIRQSWTLPESPQQNGVAERCIGLVMDIACTSMIHARAPHFWWPYVLRYAAHQLNLQPRVSRPEVSPTSLWIGSPGVGSAFHVWGCLALVPDTSADKLSACAIPCVFLGFLVGSRDYSFYHPPLHQFLDSCDVRFDESVSYYTQYPYRGLPDPPPPLFLTPSLPPAPAPLVPPPPLVLPRQVTMDSVGVGAGGAASGGTRSGGARLRGAGARGAGAGGASPGGAGAGGPGTGGASYGGVGAGGASFGGAGAGCVGTGGASSGGAGAGGAGTGGASSGGAGVGGAGAIGAGTEETGDGGLPTASPTAPPHRHDTRFQALRRLEREEQEQLEQERQELQRLDQQQLFPPVSGLRALGLPSSPPIHSVSYRVRSYVSSSGLDFGCFLSSSVTVASSCCPARLDLSLSSTCSALISSCRPPHRLVSFSSSSFLACVCAYVDAVPPPKANVVDGMWLFKVKRPPSSPPAFKARYMARGFSQREGVDFFHTFTPTPKMTTLQVLLHVAALRDYEPHSLEFSTVFLQGRLYEEIWLWRPPGFTDTFPPGTQWSLRRPVYGLRQSPREWHGTLRSTLRDLGFRPSSADLSLFVRTGSTPLFILVHVDKLVFPTADMAALIEVKSEQQKRHKCTDLGELQRYLGLHITRDRAARTITLTQSHMVQQVLRRFGFQFSTTQPTPLAVDNRLTGPFPDKPFESSGPYAELVGCLMYLMTCTRPDLAFPLSVLSRFVATGRHRPVHWTAAVRVAKYLATTSGMGLVLGGTQPVVLTGHCDSSYADDVETHDSGLLL
ncbi:unnamed protein product [Closterium sp. NIES-54]